MPQRAASKCASGSAASRRCSRRDGRCASASVAARNRSICARAKSRVRVGRREVRHHADDFARRRGSSEMPHRPIPVSSFTWTRDALGDLVADDELQVAPRAPRRSRGSTPGQGRSCRRREMAPQLERFRDGCDAERRCACTRARRGAVDARRGRSAFALTTAHSSAPPEPRRDGARSGVARQVDRDRRSHASGARCQP